MPPGGEAEARAFYGGILGLREVAKPAALADRGGAWFASGTAQVHLGVDADFRPARKAHPALVVNDLDAALAQCRVAGSTVAEATPIPGLRRAYVYDPFGNRIELVEVMTP
jgi:catechol 2,3-dioxygenase-like lactoylglutathione lyase family enzyme